VAVLKYMLLCKIMSGEVQDVPGIIASKAGLKYAGPDVDAMRAVAKAYENRSLGEFQATLQSFSAQLQDDAVVHGHLTALYDMMLEQNLIRIIEPYSRVEVAHCADQIKLPLPTVEAKLSQMILDKKFCGTLDQGIGVLEIFEDAAQDAVYTSALETIDNMGRVVDSLFTRSSKIIA
jgi:26S proteasome regulatory subunit N6